TEATRTRGAFLCLCDRLCRERHEAVTRAVQTSAGSAMNLLQRHPRLATAFALGIAAALVPFRNAEADSLHLHFLIGWNVTVWTYLALIGWLIVRAGEERPREISHSAEPTRLLALLLVLRVW